MNLPVCSFDRLSPAYSIVITAGRQHRGHMPKHSLRRTLLEQRNCVPDADRALMGLAAQNRCIELPEFIAAGVVALYAPVHNELETSLLFMRGLETGKIILFPAVAENGLEFRRVKHSNELSAGRFGIREPSEGCRLYHPGDVDFFIVPGVAFDLSCRRIGYGKGFYDKALHAIEGRGRLAGFCYDFQLVEAIPAAPHDVQMDLVITDRRVVRESGNFT